MATRTERSEMDSGGGEVTMNPSTPRIEDPHASLPGTARDIVAAAKRVLEQRGYGAVTLANVAAEARVNKASVLYHFRNKAGLVNALVDLVVHEELVRMVEACPPSVTGEERLRAAMEGKYHMIQALDETRAYYDIVPHAIRDPELRHRVAATYPKWCEQNLYWLGLSGAGPVDRDEILAGLGRLVSAVVDGLGIQAQMDRDGLDPRTPLRTFEFLLRNSMDQLQEMAARGDGESPSPGPSSPS